MPNNMEGRNTILKALRGELVGPLPQGKEIDCTQPISFDDASQSYGPWHQQGSGEEILQRDPPCKRYGVGVLYSLAMPADDEAIKDQSLETFLAFPADEEINEVLMPSAQKSMEQIEKRPERSLGETENSDVDIPLANNSRPSSMGISFLAEVPQEATLTVEVSGGRYQKHIVYVQGKERIWWLRSSVTIIATFEADNLCSPKEAKIPASETLTENLEGLDIHVEVFSRPYPMNDKRLITVCLVNRSKMHGSYDQSCLFQTFFKASISSSRGNKHIFPYPDSTAIGIDNSLLPLDEEEESLALLYRKAKTFAVGHSCAANWESLAGTWQSQFTDKVNSSETVPIKHVEAVAWVSAECLPAIEIPSTTPNVTRRDGTVFEVEMAPLSGLVPGNDGVASLEEVTMLYEGWIEQKIQEITALDPRYHPAAQKHIEECRKCVRRMKQGLHYLKTTPLAKRAFQLANYAMLLQQLHAGREPRRYQFDKKSATITFSPAYTTVDSVKPEPHQGKWRAFQIAFLLMSIQSTADAQSEDRELVELIWFPTGGGKTEAYLGLAAFAMFMRRLEDVDDVGVQVLMRYTLRLLTAQQFQRASSLVCAMEYLRRRNSQELGQHEFSIGIWLGNATTPNKRDEAIQILNGLNRNEKYVENKFLVSRCPWCRAQMGPIKLPKEEGGKPTASLGYTRRGNSVVFFCPDNKCDFNRELPIYVIDEDIYDKYPTMLIGTVDKFALIAWNEKVRSIFGINKDGTRVYSPPNLIIQDELHLISGPLGSMVGLYETIIEELCTDRRHKKVNQPKIVSSTATIRRYKEQVHRLYGRSQVALFPPPGLSADDSFFAQYATDREGKLEHGRIYVGVHAPGLGSLQTVQVRSFTALLQAPLALVEKERDPWWTMLLFFNSLRELGTTLSLFQSDIPDYFRVLMNRTGIPFQGIRKFWNILELTGRLQNDEVPAAIAKLEVEYEREGQDNHPVDVCLASNIIEVGVDIDRLSLMTVVGQPKTTSQYIQVTGRIGRRWSERPGLVVTLYGPTRPRDRSHYEKFRSYHERLYAQVEPTSVTPFSPPILDRALHAIMVAYVRQMGNKDNAHSPYPYPEHLIEQLRQIVIPRVQAIDPDELPNFIRVFDERIKQWKNWQRSVWDKHAGADIPLLLPAGAYISPEQKRFIWPTANSMRDVDAQCDATITGLYARTEEESDND